MLPYIVAGRFTAGRNPETSVRVIRWRSSPPARRQGENVIG
nr:MAG TPA: hypothetical protein [Caudoviricetes sp.]